MHTLPFRRSLICVVAGAQLLACTGAAVGAGPTASTLPAAGDWAASAPTYTPALPSYGSAQDRTSFGPLAVQPNFQAPAATSCARSIRSQEVPGRNNQAYDAATTSWARGADMAAERPATDKLAGTERLRKSKTADRAAATGRGEPSASVLAELAPSAPLPSSALPPPPPAAMAPQPSPSPIAKQVPQSNPTVPVTAGVIDDNANFSEYLAFVRRTRVAHSPRDVSERYLLQVRDAAGRSVSDAEVRVQSPGGQAMWARTDAGGQVWVAPNSFDSSRVSTYQISVRKPGRSGMAQATAFLQRGQKSAIDVTLDAAPAARAQLDLVFMVDATGSMGDEIDKLKATLRTIANEVANLPAKPDLCFGLVAYRDKTDDYLLRSYDFTNDLNAFQGVLNQLQAGGGGDYPEAMNEALQHTVHSLSWRGNGTTRMVFLLADAPPHLDYGGPQYDEEMQAALGKGIKVFGVGASGLDKQGEFIQRQIAQYTGGKFVFLTYAEAHNPASGPGRETVHDVQNYSVDSLDRLIVRLVREDLARLGKS